MNVLVTGAGGSIGSAICERICRDWPTQKLVLVSLTESALVNITRKLPSSLRTEIVPVLGSVEDYDLMREILQGIDLVIHAAAHKHVPLCESNPLAAISNNVGGMYNLCRAANVRNVGRFVLISSDKAVEPVSVMGKTKRVAEDIGRCFYWGPKTKFSAVRLVNVRNSAGSVIPLWEEQIARGGPVTVTDPEVERYFITVEEAVDAVFGAWHMSPGLFTATILNGPEKLVNIAKELIGDRRIQIVFTGLRPGERITEPIAAMQLEHTDNPSVARVVEQRDRINFDVLGTLIGAARLRQKDLALQLLDELSG